MRWKQIKRMMGPEHHNQQSTALLHYKRGRKGKSYLSFSKFIFPHIPSTVCLCKCSVCICLSIFVHVCSLDQLSASHYYGLARVKLNSTMVAFTLASAPGPSGMWDSKQATVGCLSWGYTTAWVPDFFPLWWSWGENSCGIAPALHWVHNTACYTEFIIGASCCPPKEILRGLC